MESIQRTRCVGVSESELYAGPSSLLQREAVVVVVVADAGDDAVVVVEEECDPSPSYPWWQWH